MYQMPGEVIKGERPGLLGLNLYQIFGCILGFFVASVLFDSLPLMAVGVAAGIVLASRRKGLYIIESLYCFAQWLIVERIAPVAFGKEAEPLDPAALYAQQQSAQDVGTFILRDPQTGAVSILKG